MSAACAVAAIPNITIANRALRIEPLLFTPGLCANHRSLTLINRCRASSIGMIVSKNRRLLCAGAALRGRDRVWLAQNKTARETSRAVKKD
jgi:hypothetical protein